MNRIQSHIMIKTYGISHDKLDSIVDCYYKNDFEKIDVLLKEFLKIVINMSFIHDHGDVVEFITDPDEEDYRSFFVERKEAFEDLLRAFMDCCGILLDSKDRETYMCITEDAYYGKARQWISYFFSDKYIDDMVG